MSNYIEVIAIVEGKTEQIFIEKILQPYLADKGIFIYATLVSKPGQKGGDVRFERVINDIGRHLKQRKNIYVTTFIDYYGTDSDWPGINAIPQNATPAQIAETVNTATKKEVWRLLPNLNAEARFIPFIAVHEFEALLFSDSEEIAQALGINKAEVDAVLQECGEPEAINNSPNTAPSKRLGKWLGGVKFPKTTMGITIAQNIGIAKMREKCPLFNNWLTTVGMKLL